MGQKKEQHRYWAKKGPDWVSGPLGLFGVWTGLELTRILFIFIQLGNPSDQSAAAASILSKSPQSFLINLMPCSNFNLHQIVKQIIIKSNLIKSLKSNQISINLKIQILN